MSDKREALLPCPFCGSTAERGIFGSGKGHIVACSSDYCDGKIGMEMELSREQATTLWNTRAFLEQKAEPVAEYQANFLWPYEDGSIEALGYEFANAKTDEYQREVWQEIVRRTTPPSTAEVASVDDVARKLLVAFQKAEPDHAISKNPVSFMATFAEMARAVVGCSPSTAEVEARALEDYAVFVESGEEWEQLSAWLPLRDAKKYLRSFAEHFPFACILKRIREQSND